MAPQNEYQKADAVEISAGTAFRTGAPTKRLRMGVLGGRFGQSFRWDQHPDSEVGAICDISRGRRAEMAKTFGCATEYERYEDMLADSSIDAVAIFSGAPVHVEQAIQAMQRGKHVISAVPACLGSIEEGERLLDAVTSTGLIYMMAETGYFQQSTICARRFYEEGLFGNLYYCEAEYQHAGLEEYFIENGQRTWRYGFPPMYYSTHPVSQLVSVTGERMVQVMCNGWGDEDPILRNNPYKNPFWCESAFFRTNRGNSFRVNVWWKGAHCGCERAQWIGGNMSFYSAHPNGLGPVIVRSKSHKDPDNARCVRYESALEPYTVPNWWETELLPEPLRRDSGHEGSHSFLIHEFVDAVTHQRQPVIDIYEALAYTIPGIVAHQSALRGGACLKIPQFERPAS